MKKKGLSRHLLAVYFVLVLMAVGTAGLASLWLAQVTSQEEIFRELESSARKVASQIELIPHVRERSPHVRERSPAALQQALIQMDRTGHTHFRLFRFDGTVLADSREEPERIFGNTHESFIAKARSEEVTHSRSFDFRNRRERFATFLRVSDDPESPILRISVSNPMGHFLQRMVVYIVFLSLGLAILTTIALYLLLQRKTLALREVQVALDKLTQGDTSTRISRSEIEEFSRLADGLRNLTRDHERQIHMMLQQRRELETVLSSMVEGVLAIDSQERVMNINEAAAQLLRTHVRDSRGKNIHEIVRNPDLEKIIQNTFHSDEAVEGEIIIRSDVASTADRYIRIHGTRLRNAEGANLGALIVLNDLTRLHKLENLRREFVANVSHELRTPLTSIRGFVETLIDGAAADPQDRERFLQIILRQVERLGSLIDDLLSLSRIERDAEHADIAMAPRALRPILEAALLSCQAKAKTKSIATTLLMPADITMQVNADLLEQAVTNLIENAVKYSEEGKHVEVSVDAQPQKLRIAVKDQGPGIASEHIPRLFERFYRIDKARSRNSGGTGLGLSIVKHIAQAHGGLVTVESQVGHGSTFTIELPRKSS